MLLRVPVNVVKLKKNTLAFHSVKGLQKGVMPGKPLVSLNGANVNLSNRTVLRNIHFTLLEGHNWLISGSNGAGKSTFLRLLGGYTWPQNPDSRMYYHDGVPGSSPLLFRRQCRVVSPERQAFYQKYELNIRVLDAILSGLNDNVVLSFQPNEREIVLAEEMAGILNLTGLLQRRMLGLSEGERKKVLLARALVARPKVLLLDEFLNDQDRVSRDYITGLLSEMNQQVVAISHRPLHAEGFANAFIENQTLVSKPSTYSAATGFSAEPGKRNHDIIFQCKDLDLYLDYQQVLHSITWKMHRNENWLVLGENGSGKTSFLRMLYGEANPAENKQVIRNLGQQPGSLNEIRSKIGFISAHLQDTSHYGVNVEELIISGIRSTIGIYHDILSEEREAAWSIAEALGITSLLKRPIAETSFGELRKAILARALVKEREVFILDEPFSGLDLQTRIAISSYLTSKNIPYILSSHFETDFLPEITHVLALQQGKISFQGGIGEYNSRRPFFE